jgi:hypothetical protein
MVGILGYDSRRGKEISLFITVSRTALGPIQTPIQWVSGALSLGVKRPGREADHSRPPSAIVKNASSYTSTPQYAFTAWCSVKAEGQLYMDCTRSEVTCRGDCSTTPSPFYEVRLIMQQKDELLHLQQLTFLAHYNLKSTAGERGGSISVPVLR